ncbi:sensor histidine kinase [Actinomadura sp. LD22]|uniref:Sensor histidine kinase n=1 Tax=Actinomadura physcomitrii TaxID=2650748 RepID=A0A6I4MBR8_9ACTN|nr:histidine kinase [Actinomadura physcomitrii]MWA03688.1 sensor histidine kinase [Actinomadura physcomitrii]
MKESGKAPSHEQFDTQLTPLPFYFWLVIATGTASGVLEGELKPTWLAGLGLVAFAVLDVAAIHLHLRRQAQVPALAALAALGALTVAMNAGFGPDTDPLFALLSIACGLIVPWRYFLPPIVVGAVSGVAALMAWRQGGDVFTLWYGSLSAGIVVAILTRLMAVIIELRDAREELARHAVVEERIRFSRDLHDLLGHTLSVIVVKAEGIRRVAPRDPGVAERFAGDIEEIGREALREVREAVTGYRESGVAAELDKSFETLRDAGIECVIRQSGTALPADADTLLGWVIREGVTNVIRHSGAGRCEIDVRNDDHELSVEIRDDGRGAGDGDEPSGNGLRGLRERLAAGDGIVQVSSRRGGGFRLRATLPAHRPVKEKA